MDKEIFSKRDVEVERKLLSFDLKENARGRFLRITENVGGRRDTVVIPSSGLEEVLEIMTQVVEAHRQAGPSQSDYPEQEA